MRYESALPNKRLKLAAPVLQSLQIVLSHESLDRPPPNEDDVVIDESLTKLGAGHDVDIALAPGGIPYGEVHGDRAHLCVVVREVHE